MRNHSPDVTHVTPEDGSKPYWLICKGGGFEAKLPAYRYSIETVMEVVRLIDRATHASGQRQFKITSIPPCRNQAGH